MPQGRLPLNKLMFDHNYHDFDNNVRDVRIGGPGTESGDLYRKALEKRKKRKVPLQKKKKKKQKAQPQPQQDAQERQGIY